MNIRLALALVGLLQLLRLAQVQAIGVGHSLIMNRGSILRDDFTDAQQPVANHPLFSRVGPSKQHQSQQDDYERYAQLASRWRIDVVITGQSVSYLMNVVSTNVFRRLLADFDSSFKELKMDDVDRPMLRAYLSVLMATDEEIREWSRLRRARNFDGSCRSLLEKRNEEGEKSFPNKDEQHELLDLAEKLRKPDNHHLAYLVFQDNLNLFMLESHLHLCNRLELGAETRQAFLSWRPLF